jgi:hypothetical protein
MAFYKNVDRGIRHKTNGGFDGGKLSIYSLPRSNKPPDILFINLVVSTGWYAKQSVYSAKYTGTAAM